MSALHDTTPAEDNAGPLDGIRVVEFGQLIAAPYCGQLFADFGADVIKVEQPDVGDPMRQWGHVVDGRSLSWKVIARGKRCVTADLRDPAGLEFARDLIRTADIVLENFRPGTMERFGLGWDETSAINPRAVMIRISGYGQTGPYAGRAGYGSIGEAMGGIRYLTGDPDRPPSRTGVSLGDMLAGQHGFAGGMVALRARDRTGRGQVVDVSIYESVLAITEALVSEYALTGEVRERTGSVLPGVAPSNLYPTSDGQYVLIAANQDTVFRRLASAMGRSELAESHEYATHIERGARQEELDDLISVWSATLSADDLLAVLNEHGVPAGRVYTAPDMLADPHFAARGSIVGVNDPTLGEIPMQNVSPKLSDTPGRIRWAGSDSVASHEQEVREMLRADSTVRADP